MFKIKNSLFLLRLKCISHLSVRRPSDDICDLPQIRDVSGSALDQVPRDEFPVFGDGEGQLARGVDAHVCHAGGVLHQGLLHLPVLGTQDAERLINMKEMEKMKVIILSPYLAVLRSRDDVRVVVEDDGVDGGVVVVQAAVVLALAEVVHLE